jgi:hypothetical protein
MLKVALSSMLSRYIRSTPIVLFREAIIDNDFFTVSVVF